MGIVKKIYESSKPRVFFSWAVTAILTTFLLSQAAGLLLMWTDIHRDTILNALPFIVLFSVALASYLAFFWWNIKVEVNDQEVVFFRGKKAYLRFKFEENSFSAVVFTDAGGWGKSAGALFLQVLPHGAERSRGYKLHNFSRQTFEECMSHIASLNIRQNLQQEVPFLDESFDTEEQLEDSLTTKPLEELIRQSVEGLRVEPLIFHVNKQAYIKRTRNTFLSMAIPMTIAVAILVFGVLVSPFITQNQLGMDNFASGVVFVVIVTAIFAALAATLGWIPFRTARNNTPERIAVHYDRIVIDGDSFEFDHIRQVKMTTPDFRGIDRTFRILEITESNRSKKYTLGYSADGIANSSPGKKSIKALENYDALFSLLRTIFALRAQDGKRDVFTIT